MKLESFIIIPLIRGLEFFIICKFTLAIVALLIVFILIQKTSITNNATRVIARSSSKLL